MALVLCRECGREISTEANACPNCGAPQGKATKLPPVTQKKKGMSLFGKIFLGFFGLVVLIGALSSIHNGGGAGGNNSEMQPTPPSAPIVYNGQRGITTGAAMGCTSKDDLNTYIAAFEKADSANDTVGKGDAAAVALASSCLVIPKGSAGLVVDYDLAGTPHYLVRLDKDEVAYWVTQGEVAADGPPPSQ